MKDSWKEGKKEWTADHLFSTVTARKIAEDLIKRGLFSPNPSIKAILTYLHKKT